MILTTITDVAPGSGGDDFRVLYNGHKDTHYTNYDAFRSRVEQSYLITFGHGIISGSYTPPLFTTPGGLTLGIGSHQSLISLATVLTGTTTKLMVDNATRFVWEFQDNTDAVPHYELTELEVNPGVTDNPAHLLAEVTTLNGAITQVTERFNVIDTYFSNQEKYETFELVWDADPATRTGGTVFGGTLASAPQNATNLKCFVDGKKIPNLAVTINGDAWEIIDGYKPIAYVVNGVTYYELVEFYYV